MLTLDNVLEAFERIRPYASRTLCKRSTYLSELLGFNLFLKFENLQHTGSFKIRGAANKLIASRAEIPPAGVIAASAGNHAQGVAKMATTLGIKSTIVMPEPSPLVKIQSTKGYGAEVVLHGEIFDEAFAHAQKLVAEKGAMFIHPFDDPLIMAGQGTAGLEILEDVKQPDMVVVCLGGGGLLGGIATAVRSKAPKARIIGVQTIASPNVGRKVMDPKASVVPTTTTFADGIAVKYPAQRVVEYLHKIVDEVVFVTEEEIAQAILVLMEKVKTVVEGAGAAAFAALLAGKICPKPGSTVVATLSGGNVDVRLLGNIIQHGLSLAGRMLGVKILTDDRPGALLRITQSIAAAKGNIVQVYHHRDSSDIPLGQTEIEVHIETRGAEHKTKLLSALEEGGFRVNALF